jgi:ribosomal protein L37AE/L43A
MFDERKAAILLLMQANPAEDWRMLAEHYREMSEGELEELAADIADLTETAQQVLRSELRNRGLGEPRAAGEAPNRPDRAALPRHDWPEDPDAGEFPSARAGGNAESDLPREFTWKTTLCECEDRAEAWQICEVLRREGIESWIEPPGSGIVYPRVLVAADELDEAREIAARPIPQEIVELSHMEVPEFEAPKCPKCGAEDPVLEAVEPANAWLCEVCGKQWTEPAANLSGKTEEEE